MKNIYLILLSFTTFFLLACNGPKKEKETQVEEAQSQELDGLEEFQPEEVQSQEPESERIPPVEKGKKRILTSEMLPGDFVHEYSVLLSWEQNPQFKKWLIKKYLIKEKSSKFTEVLESQTLSWLDKDIQEGQFIQYELWGTSFSGEREIVGSQIVYVPTDILIEGNQHINQWETLLKSNKPIGRLIFLQNASLQIQNKAFKVKVREIYAEEGHLLSFPLAQKAEMGEEGRHGGSIAIYAEKAEGTLHLHLHGESGGDGQNGLPLGIEGKGKRGPKGKPAQYEDIYKGCLLGQMDMCIDSVRTICKKAPTHGQAGKRGKKGNAGTDGKRGGHSSPLYLDIKDGSHFRFTLANSPGDGGIGGDGGPGGKGGDGGTAGDNPDSHACYNAKAGKRGPQGSKGNKGNSGALGVNSPICIRINGVERLGCYEATSTDSHLNTKS